MVIKDDTTYFAGVFNTGGCIYGSFDPNGGMYESIDNCTSITLDGNGKKLHYHEKKIYKEGKGNECPSVITQIAFFEEKIYGIGSEDITR